MTVEQVKLSLAKAGFEVKSEARLKDDTGTCIRLATGALVNVYDNGNFNVQGKNQQPVKLALGTGQVGERTTEPYGPANNRVFVVYGHDTEAKTQLEAMLRRWGLEPLILDQLPSEGQTIIEKLESYTGQVEFAVVLATPDDVGYRAGHEDESSLRARQNVVLELGMLLSRLGRKRVAILLKQQEKMERPSDIQGLIYIPFKDDIAKEAGVLLAKEMTAQGYRIEIQKL